MPYGNIFFAPLTRRRDGDIGVLEENKYWMALSDYL
jgi:hypothetical protein